MKKLFILLLAVATGTGLRAQSVDEIAIISVLDQQMTSWNQGNLEKFMEGYWKSDSLTFIGKSGATYGYDSTLSRYKTYYPDTAAMGRLTFAILHVKQLSPTYYFVIGKYHLKRTKGDLAGHYTLLFRKINGKWKIVSDHSS